MDQRARAAVVGQVRDLVSDINPYKHPFLHMLPELLERPEFSHTNVSQLLTFTRIALQEDTQPIIADALKILNRIVNPDGTFNTPAPDIFYLNSNFFWKELGGHTEPINVISHVLNKTLMVSSVGQY